MAEEHEKKFITSDELKKHNKPQDLWLSIQGRVYNVTDWSKTHPGGPIPLLNLAGQDVTDAFIAFHPASAWKFLDNFFTGYYLEDFEVSEVSKDYRNLSAKFTKLGLFENMAHGVIFSLFLAAALLSVIVSGVVCSDSFLIHMLSGGLLGFTWMQITYLGHDAGHYNIMTSPGFNKFAPVRRECCQSIVEYVFHSSHIPCAYQS